MNLEQITNLLNQLTTYFNISRKNTNVLPSAASEFLKNQLTESSYWFYWKASVEIPSGLIHFVIGV